MKRVVFWLLFASALWALLVTACALPHGGVLLPGVPPQMYVNVEVSDATTGRAIEGASVRYWFKGSIDTAVEQTTSSAGTAQFFIPISVRDSHMWVKADGYVAQNIHVDALSGQIVRWRLQKTIPEPVEADAPWRANFLGSHVPWSRDEVLFDIFLPTYSAEQRQQVYAMKRAEGLNRIILAARGDYHGTRPFDFSHNPDGLAALMAEVRAAGFRPVVFLSPGDAGTGWDTDAYFGPLLDGLGSVRDKAEYVPGWEVVKGGWTSRQFVHAVEVISRHVSPTTLIWFHGSDGRGTFSSNPVETDDPTHGDEIGAWRTEVGKRLAGVLYQSESGRVLLKADQEPLDYLGQRGWRGRATEILMRVLRGERGWPPKRLVLFETVAEDYYWGRATDDDVTRIANEGLALGFVEFGNGLPGIR